MPNFTRNICRYERPCEPLTLKQWLSCRLHHHAKLRPEEIAATAEIPYSRLKAFANEGQDAHIGAEALVRFCRATDSPDGIDFLLAPLGFVMVKKELATSDTHVVAEALDVSARSGRLASLVRGALKDGIDDQDRADIRDECRAIMREVAEVEAAAAPLQHVVLRAVGK